MRFAANEQSLLRLHLLGTLTIVMLLTLGLAAYFSWQSRVEHHASIERVSQGVQAQQHARLRAEIDSAVSFLNFTRTRTGPVLRQRLSEQVDTAMQMVQAMYDRESKRRPPAAVKQLIIEALRPMRFFDGRGYFFIDDMQGQFILLPTAPQLEGQTKLDNRDDRGHYIMRGLIDAARQPDGQGFSRYRWYSPDVPKEMTDKLAYVRYFEPFDWLIGTGDYTYKWEQQQQLAVLERLRGVRFGQSGRIGVLDGDGRVLLAANTPSLEGQPLSSLPEPQRAILEQVLAKARRGGGLMQADWSDDGTSLMPKTAVVQWVAPWGWTLIASISDNELQHSLRQEMAREVSASQRLRQWLLPLLLALALGLGASWAFSQKWRSLFALYHDDIRVKNQSIARSEALFRAVFDNAAVGIAQASPTGEFMQMNQCYCNLLGYSLDEVMQPGFNFRRVTLPDDLAADEQHVRDLLNGHATSFSMEKRYIRKDGSIVWAYLAVQLVQATDGTPQYFIAAVHDISERKQAEDRLRLAASVFTHAREGILITEIDGTIIDINESFTRITGYTRDDAVGQNPRLLKSGLQSDAYYSEMWRSIADNGHWFGETWNRRKNGEIFVEMQTVSVVCDANGQPRHYVSLFSDITALKEHERQLEHIAHFDALTGLPNRVLLADRLGQAMLQALRRGQKLAVAYLDLDGFKSINDLHGHEAGDRVLMGVASRMKEVLREGDTLARLGGDEFIAVLVDLPETTTSLPLLTRLLDAAAEPIQLGGQCLQVSASLGATFYPQSDSIDAEQLQRQADQAMYQAKLAGKNRYHLFDAEQDRSARGHFESLEHIRHALQNEQLVLYYQPKVNMRSGKVIGAEALIRWQHPQRGLLAPAQFLPVIENHSLAVEVGEWVISSALRQMELWHIQGLSVPVSVNVGARQLQQRDFVSRLQVLLGEHPEVPPKCLELEVLETSALEDISGVSTVIEACRGLGVMFALDDFGTGYSSLTYLKRLPVALLKIDQSFVRDMLDDADDLAILQGVIGLAKAFHRTVIAEGVETIAHGTALLALGCEQAQGYGIARPMPATDFVAWAAAWRPDPAWHSPGSTITDV